MQFDAMIEQGAGCIGGPRFSNTEMHLEAEIKLNLGMQLEAMIDRV